MLRLLIAIVAAGCAGSGGNGETAASGDSGTPAPPTGDNDRASLLLEVAYPWLGNEAGASMVGGVFVSDDLGIANLSQCLLGLEPRCLETLPAEVGDFYSTTPPPLGFERALSSLSAGGELTLGPLTVAEEVDDETGLAFFRSVSEGPLGFNRSVLDLEVQGGEDWPAGSYGAVLDLPSPMVVTSHDPQRVATFFDADLIRLRWLPSNTGGDVDLWVRTQDPGPWTVLRLGDDGAYDLDLSLRDGGLADGAPVELRLVRSARAVLGEADAEELAGRELDVTVELGQQLSGTYRAIGSREILTDGLYDTCTAAEAADALLDGHYGGSFVGFGADLDPGATGCTGANASVADAILPIEVQPDEKLVVDYLLFDDDASVYLLSDCNDVLTCVAGADEHVAVNAAGEESVEYVNTTGKPVRLYLVLDGFDEVTSDFRLTVDLSSTGGDPLQNFCADAIRQGTIAPGRYDGSIADHVNNLNAYDNARCENVGQLGGEGIAQLRVAPGETLRATSTAAGAKPSLQLLTNCGVAASCVASGEATVDWTNDTPFTQTLFLVLDSEAGIGEYTLDVEIE